MLKNYFKIALRTLGRSKAYAFINIAGLSIGLACAMLIILYVKDEVSFDRFHSNVKNIYRVASAGTDLDGKNPRKMAITGYFQGPTFKQHLPSVESFVRIQSSSEDIKLGDEVKSQDVLIVDSSFFKVFSFPLLSGDPATCLNDPYAVVLSEDMAKKQFGTTDAIGKTLQVKDQEAFVNYKVTAVAKRTPINSSLQFDVLHPMKVSAEDASNPENWFNFFLNTFLVLNPNANVAAVEKQMQSVYEKESKDALKIITEKYGPDNFKSHFILQPYTDMHMSTEMPAVNGLTNASNPMYAYILSGIALFILLIACINFVNLTVARSVKRAKEIGIRKVIGGERKQLIFQFLGESFILCTIAFLASIILVQLILPLFNELSNKRLALSYLFDVKLIAGYVILFLLTSLLAGFYPAIVLSGYSPVETLYSRFNLAGKNYLQKSLVVLQFSLASFLIIATFIIYAQFNFLTTQQLGYDDSNLVLVNKDQLAHDKAAVFRHELMKDPNIVAASSANGGMWQTVAKLGNDSSIQFAYETVNESYLPMMKIPLLQGRNFSTEYPADSAASVIVNESFVKKAGWKNPLGEMVNFWYQDKIYHVIGVVKDHHFASLNEKIMPQLFTMKPDNKFGTTLIRIRPGTATASLAYIQKTFRQMFPISPYSYVFKDQQNLKSYESEQRWKQIMLFGAVLTIFISCIGLFGLSVLAAEKRTKEIGIRKVLGASVQGIVTILSKDFLKLVGIALLIAIPLARMAGNKWLENYPYRVNIGWWLFAGAAIMVVCIALFTISFQAIKAAVTNPVKSLRSE